MRRFLNRFLFTGVFLLISMQVQAENYDVKMLNRGAGGERMVYEPAFLHIKPGDSVTFLPTDKTHNAESIRAMMPQEAKPFKGKVNEKITVKFEEEGTYGVVCRPHYALGMVGLILVGDYTVNLEDAQMEKHPPLAKKRFDEMFTKAAEQ